jgi:hypothetical protein
MAWQYGQAFRFAPALRAAAQELHETPEKLREGTPTAARRRSMLPE